LLSDLGALAASPPLCVFRSLPERLKGFAFPMTRDVGASGALSPFSSVFLRDLCGQRFWVFPIPAIFGNFGTSGNSPKFTF
jgi:hypothetical protein